MSDQNHLLEGGDNQREQPLASLQPDFSMQNAQKQNNAHLYIIIVLLVLLLAFGSVGIISYLRTHKSESSSVQMLETEVPESDSITLFETKISSGSEIDPETISDTEDDLYKKITPEPTVLITEARKPPEINCEIEVQGSEIYDGYSYTLKVNGRYDYYYIECYEYDMGSSNDPYLGLSGNNEKSSLYLTAGSSLDHVTVNVTPYYSDGTKGETVTCTAVQPIPQIQSEEVYSCYKTGEINGTGAPGYTTSYIVDHGSKTTVRDTLGDRWHVTAYNYCYSNGSTWYELYDTDDGDYYGWVDSSHISFYFDPPSPVNNTVEVYSCYKTGEINGKGVAGFTTSYVVDGGAKTTVRDTLGNTWHVTAYNYCYAYELTWYELYDTDDGDYYGWVDSNFIKFYGE